MTLSVYVSHSHEWLYEELVGPSTGLPEGLALVDDRREADCILHLDPPWVEPSRAPDRLSRFSPRELARTFVYSQRASPIKWAPGIYTGVNRTEQRSTFLGGFYVPAQHGRHSTLPAELERARAIDPDLLWSFVGTVKNADVREVIVALADPRALIRDTERWSEVTRWGWWGALKDEGERTFRDYAEAIGRSKFVVCPRGIHPNSIRIFEALQVGRCPVIIADEWLPPPFVDWSSCSIRIDERQAGSLPAILREREGEAAELGRQARLVWDRWFAPGERLSTLFAECQALRERVSARARVAVALRVAGDPMTAKRLKWDFEYYLRERRAAADARRGIAA